jgi:tRNA threonylcarbamoyladenosine biosynthesis protein TsaB
MALILSIETATKVCSVGLALDGKSIATKEIKSEKFSHSENLNLFIQSLFENSKYSINDLEAVAVSKGPGSYTGLRIGVSTAKGLCYGLDIPLISINSLKAVASLCSEDVGVVIPMFDARRMEVYSAVYSKNLEVEEEVRAVVIDDESYKSFLSKGKVLFVGPGAQKCQEILTNQNAVFDLKTEVTAIGMMSLAEDKFNDQLFEDVAYFEPFYLKEFIAGTPKKIF